MSKEIAIDLADTFSLLAVWSLTDCEWKLLKITRLKQAIALAQEPGRLVKVCTQLILLFFNVLTFSSRSFESSVLVILAHMTFS